MSSSFSEMRPSQEILVGSLRRKSGTFRRWTSFTYVLDGIYLKEFSSSSHYDSDNPRKIFDVFAADIREIPNTNGIIIKARNGTVLTLLANTPEEAQKWNKNLSNPIQPIQFISCAAIIAPVRRRQSSITSTMRKKNLKSVCEIVTDEKGVIIETDKGGEAMFGYHKEDMVGQRLFFLFTLESATHYTETFSSYVEETRKADQPGKLKNLHAVRKGQEEFSASVSLDKIRDGAFRHRFLDRSSSVSAPPEIVNESADKFKTIGTLRLDIMEGRGLSSETPKFNKWYCVIELDGNAKTSTSTKTGTDSPFWGEEFVFEDIKPSQKNITIVVHNESKQIKDPRFGKISVDISELSQTGRVTDKWISLSMFRADQKSEATIRIKASFTVEKILPFREYKDILEIFMDDKLVCASALAKVANTQLDDVAGTLVNIFAMKNRVTDFVRTLAAIEIEKTDKGNIIFRGNSLSTKVIDQYMKMVGFDYLLETLTPLISEVLSDTEGCEVDPTRIDKGTDIKKNQKKLLSYTQKFFEKIQKSVTDCPAEMKMVFSNLREEVCKKFRDIERHTSVSGFIFLRFFCPAILNPKMFGICGEHPTGVAARTLTLVAKSLQNLANLVPTAKEQYMDFIEPYISANLKNMEECVDDFCRPPEATFEFSGTGSTLDLCREMCALFRHCFEAKEGLQLLLGETNEPKLKELFKVMDKLEKKQIEYERRSLDYIKKNPSIGQRTISLTGIHE